MRYFITIGWEMNLQYYFQIIKELNKPSETWKWELAFVKCTPKFILVTNHLLSINAQEKMKFSLDLILSKLFMTLKNIDLPYIGTIPGQAGIVQLIVSVPVPLQVVPP